jgi:hypothetical protein
MPKNGIAQVSTSDRRTIFFMVRLLKKTSKLKLPQVFFQFIQLPFVTQNDKAGIGQKGGISRRIDVVIPGSIPKADDIGPGTWPNFQLTQGALS